MIDIKGVKICDKIPKICVSLIAGSREGLLREAGLAANPDIDLVEWRADCFDGILDPNERASAFSALKKALDKPLLFTVRTLAEGGKSRLSPERYSDLLRDVIFETKPDMVDIELSCGEKNCRELIAAANKNSVVTVLSSHNFEATPSFDDMLETLNLAVQLRGDIAKLAVMPKTSADTLELLAASERFSRLNPDVPLIAISMGELGKISRVAGGTFGSVITFAALEHASAPGQIPFDAMRKILKLLHI